jgi:hypothetical protein
MPSARKGVAVRLGEANAALRRHFPHPHDVIVEPLEDPTDRDRTFADPKDSKHGDPDVPILAR